jgi:protein gp37
MEGRGVSENTKIEWATHTFNPWEGCQKVGPGCDNCYAEARNRRFGGGVAVNWGPGAPRRITSAANWAKPLAWEKNHQAFFEEHGHRQRVFCASLADWADPAVPPAWRGALATVIVATPNLIWLLLTKRIGNAKAMLAKMFPEGMPPNVWIGATICNQAEADRDIPKLLEVPAAKRFLSVEPLLGPVDLAQLLYRPCRSFHMAGVDPETGAIECCKACDYTGIGEDLALDWVIVGGESGPGARPMHPDWARSLRDQCVAAGVPFFFKQWGEWLPRMAVHHTFQDGKSLADIDPNQEWGLRRLTLAGGSGPIMPFATNGDAYLQNVGKKMAGRLLDGRTWDEVPS